MRTKAAILICALVCAGATALYLAHRPGGPHPAPGQQTATPAPAAPQPTAARVTPPPSQPPPLPADPPTSLATIFGTRGEPFAARYKALHALKGPFAPQDIDALYVFLRTSGARPGTLIGGEHVLKNDVMDLLCRQRQPPPDLLSNLCALSSDTQQDLVTRDYALQHIASVCLKGTKQFAADQPAAHQALWRALAETDASIGGTALLGLHRLSQADRNLDPDRVSDAAFKLATDPRTGELTRLTALEVCAERGLKQVLPEAARLARQSESLPLRLAAIAALGSAGGASEKALLQSLPAQAGSPLQPAITTALRRLNARLGPPGDHI